MQHPILPPPASPRPSRSRRQVLLCCLGLGLPACLLAVGLVMSQPSAATGPTDTNTDSQTSAAPAETLPTVAPPPEDATVEDLRAYYDALVQQLNQLLMNERTDRFVMEYAYEQEVDKLQAIIADLEEQLRAAGLTPETSPAPESDTTPVHTETETTTDETSFTYEIHNGGAVILSYKGTARHVAVPSQLDGHPVTAIGDSAFKNTDVVSVTLPDTVTSVGWFAFYGCQSLKAVVIPASVSRIDYAAFDGCPSVTLVCPANSYAAKYAAAFGLNYSHT